MTGRIPPKVRRARRGYRCMTRSAPWCQGIRQGERHLVHVLPPHDNDIGNEGWRRERECAACAEWCGRPIPAEAVAS